MASSPETSQSATLRQYKSLLTVGSAVASHLDLHGLLKAIGSSLREVVPHDAAILILRDDETGQLHLRALDLQTLESRPFEEGVPISLDDTPEGHAIMSGKPVLVGPTVDLAKFSSPWVRHAVDSGVRSGCAVPLISNGQAFGTLSVVSSREGAFTQADVELLTLCGGQIATAVENALNFERAKRERDRFEMMSEASKAVSASLSFQELLRTTSAIVRKHIDHDFTGLCLYDEASGNFRILALDEPPEFLEEGLLLPMEGTPDGLAYQTRQPVWRSRLDVSEFPAPIVQQAYNAGMRSGCSVPLISRDRVIGVLAVASKRESSITQTDAETLQLISNQIASSVENALNFERTRQAEREIRRRFERERLMLEINNSIVSHQTLPDLLRAITVCLRRVIQDDFAGLVLYDPRTDQLLLHAIDTPNVELAPPAGLPIPKASYPGLAFSSGEIIRRNRIDRSEFPEDPILHIQTREGKRVESLCVAPLFSHGRKLGVLGLASTQENSFSDDDVQLVGGIAAQVAIAVENTLNFSDVQVAREQATTSRDRLELLLKVNNAVVSQLSLRELLRAVSSCLRETLGADVTAISLYDDKIDQLRAYLFDLPPGFGPIEEGTLLPMDGTTGSIAFRTGRPIFFDCIDPGMPVSEFDRRMIDAGIRSGGVTPLMAHNRKLGTLGVGSKREGAFSKADQELLVHIANQIGIAVENALAYEEIERLKNKLAEEKLYLEDEIRTEGNFEEIIGQSPALQQILKRIERVSPTDSTILIRGETGTGKELIARAIHNLSGRRERTLVKVNCAAIPMGLLESELFGHERGAFTGAISQRIGRFELAHQGTLFLDEVGDIPLELQPKLLRVLQEQQFERLGSTRTQQVDVRLVAATNSNLEDMVEKKQYRSDLYYRLNVFPITLPPLRERREDIPLLVRFFAQRFARRMKKRIESIPAKTNALLTQYHWPGNIRELENVIERAVILSQGPELEIPIGELGIGQVRMAAAASAPQSNSPRTAGSADPSTLQSVERDHILRVLEETRWVIAGPRGAAQRLGMKRTTLQAKMRKLGISRKNGDT